MERFDAGGHRRRAVDGGASEVPSSTEAHGAYEPAGGSEPGQDGRDVVVSTQNEGRENRGQGDLLRHLTPIEPVDFLVNVGQQRVIEQPGVRRVEVSRGEGGEIGSQGALAGPVQMAQPVVHPQGRPVVFGPPGMHTQMMAPPVFNQGEVEYPPMVFPPNAGMRMPMTDPSWFGTPVRPVEMHGPVGNPFWSPEARRALGLGEENRSVGPRRIQGGSTENGGAVERPFGMSQGRVGALNDMGGERIAPGSVGNENLQLVVGNPVQPPTDGQGVVMDPIELFRLRCMREAEQKFAQGLERMRQETNQIPEERSGSYVSLPNQGTPPGLHELSR